MAGDIKVVTGVSWLHDKLRADLKERESFLLEACGSGIPFHEYLPMVGRLRENRRMQAEIAELFTDFYQGEDTEDEELEEIDE